MTTPSKKKTTKKKPATKKKAVKKPTGAQSPTAAFLTAFTPYSEVVAKNMLLPMVRSIVMSDECHDVDDLVRILDQEMNVKLTWPQIEVALDSIGVTIVPRLSIEGLDEPLQVPAPPPTQPTTSLYTDLDDLSDDDRRFIEDNPDVGVSVPPPHVVGVGTPTQQVVPEQKNVQKPLGRRHKKIDIAAMIPDPGPPGAPGGVKFANTVDGAMGRPVNPNL